MELVKKFVSMGLSIEAKSEEGATALLLALLNRRVKVVNYLLSLGAKIDVSMKYVSFIYRWRF